MARTTDTTFTFNGATEPTYTYSASVVIDNGGARLTSTDIKTGTVETPDLDITSLTPLLDVVPTITELRGYRHVFIVSFNSGATWLTHQGDGWAQVDELNIASVGIPTNRLGQITEWPEGETSFRMQILISRTVVGETGRMDVLPVAWGTELISFAVADGGLEDLGAEMEPEYVVKPEWQSQRITLKSEGGYSAHWSRASSLRRVYDLQWFALTLAERNSLNSFLDAHKEASMTWIAPGETVALRFKALDVTWFNVATNTVFGVNCRIEQSFVGEG